MGGQFIHILCMCVYIYIYIYIYIYTYTHTTPFYVYLLIDIHDKVKKVGNHSRGLSEGSLFNSYYTEVSGRALLHSLDCSILPLILTLKWWVLNMVASSAPPFFLVFAMTQPRILNPGLPGHWQTLTIRPINTHIIVKKISLLLTFTLFKFIHVYPFLSHSFKPLPPKKIL